MRPSYPTRIAFVLMALAAGCPKASAPSTTTTARLSDDARIDKLARVLRAADRRIVDDDLRGLIADPDASVRAKAILTLGQIGDPSAVASLEKSAGDPAPEARAASAFAMGLIADAATGDTLETLAGDSAPLVRVAAADALGRIRGASGAVTVRKMLDDPESSVRASAALAAWRFPEGDPFLDPLIKCLGAPDAEVRAAAAYALARLASAAIAPASAGSPVGTLTGAGVGRARAALMDRVGDSNREVRMQVARGLASPKGGGAELAAVGSLTSDKDPGVRVNAVRALGYPGTAIQPYLKRALSDKDQHVARTAIESVAKVGGDAAVQALKGLLPRLARGWLQEAALTALATVDPTTLAGIVTGLHVNPDPVMRVAACALLAGRGEPEAIAAAQGLLNDPEPRVQTAAIPVVAEQSGAISTLLAGKFTAPDPVVRAAAGEAVGARFASTAAADSRDDLFARLNEIWSASSADKMSDAKIAVVDALAKAGKDERVASALARALADPDYNVRRRAATRYQEVYQEDRSGEVGAAVLRPLADYERIVRWSLIPHAAFVEMQRPGTAVGAFTIALDTRAAPLAAWNFAELAEKKFFDGATVHRVVPNFVVQDGDPRGDGYGGPGHSIRDEFSPLPFAAGTLGMASDGKDTAGSQWFITLAAAPHLDGRYTSFGRVVRGFRDIVLQVRPGDTVVSIRVYEGDGTQPPAVAD